MAGGSKTLLTLSQASKGVGLSAARTRVLDDTRKLLRFSLLFSLSFVAALVVADVVLIFSGFQEPNERLVDTTVINVLIGASVVQVGAAYAAIVASLFRRDRNVDMSDEEAE